MDALNHCRQLMKQCSEVLANPKGIKQEWISLAERAVYLNGQSVKFFLPNGGRLLDDRKFKALDETEELRLPYPFIALEYRSDWGARGPDVPLWGREGPVYEDDSFIDAPKRIVFAEEREDFIVVTVAFWARHNGRWAVLPECGVPRRGYLDRTKERDGLVPMVFSAPDERVPLCDYMDELAALMCFLNALQCSNVSIAKQSQSVATMAKRPKVAIPFDTYHVLVIGHQETSSNGGSGANHGGHRSPREHLRRGHIRRLHDGRRIWVNASVVAHGRGRGVVTKDYTLRSAA